ncbi:MAG: DUF2225 domain-containing protein [Candidatus Heimdallarchaeota archaeon]
MPLTLDELFTCPNCSVVFQSKTLGSYNTFGTCYSDLYIASNEDPQHILLLINICPKCGFSAFTADFKSFQKEDLVNFDEALKFVEEFTQKTFTEFNAGDGYLLISEYSKHLTQEQKSYTQMQACHSYRFLDDKNLEKTRRIVLQSTLDILNDRIFKKNPEELYLYIAGELNRLLGNNQKANEYFQKALEKAEKESFVYKITIHQLSNPNEIIPRKIFGKN